MTRSPEMGLVGALRRADDVLFAMIRVVLVALMSVMTLAVLAQVITRYVLTMSLNWSEELARLCFVCVVFLGAACLARRDQHLAVTTLRMLLPPRGERLASAAVNAVGVVCTGLLLRGALRAAEREWGQLTPAMQAPMGLVYATVVAALSLMALWMATNLFVNLTLAVGRAAPQTGPAVGPRARPKP
jgi:TRAP-type C4-dicarboxylate transport system permease small subunit